MHNFKFVMLSNLTENAEYFRGILRHRINKGMCGVGKTWVCRKMGQKSFQAPTEKFCQ